MEFIAQNWVLIAGIFVVALLLLSEPLRMRISGVEAANVFDAVSLSNHQSAIFVDVRESKEMADGVINGAYRVPLSNFDKNATQLDKFKEKPVIVYCRSGNRSIGAAGICPVDLGTLLLDPWQAAGRCQRAMLESDW